MIDFVKRWECAPTLRKKLNKMIFQVNNGGGGAPTTLPTAPLNSTVLISDNGNWVAIDYIDGGTF